MPHAIQAVVFDLDGVITDTAEYHYRAWKRLANEEQIPLTRADNEHLRGVSRRESLRRLLKGRAVDEAAMQAMMDRKSAIFQDLLEGLSPRDLLLGVAELFDLLDRASLRFGIASASRDARATVDKLGIAGRLSVLVDGHSVTRQKPAPPICSAARRARLGVRPDECLVIEDAAAGIEAALKAGMPCLALGPAERFAELEARYGPVSRRFNLAGLQLADLHAAAQRPNQVWHMDLMYLYVRPRWYYLVDVLDAHSRFLVHWTLNTTMLADTVTLTMQTTLDRVPAHPPGVEARITAALRDILDEDTP